MRASAWLLIDRLVPRADEGRARLAEAVASAFARGDGAVRRDRRGRRARASSARASRATAAGARFPLPEPALFSFNSPLGACEACQGFGRTPELDRERVVPDRDALARRAGASRRSRRRSGQRVLRKLLRRPARWRASRRDRPFGELDAGATATGCSAATARHWYGVEGFFECLERKRYKVQARVMIARYRRFETCAALRGHAAARRGARRARGRPLAAGASARLTLGELRRVARRAARSAPAQRERAGAPARGAARARRHHARGGARLPHARAPDAHALGRRGAAHPARDRRSAARSPRRSTCSTSPRSACTRATSSQLRGGAARGSATRATRSSWSSTRRRSSRRRIT